MRKGGEREGRGGERTMYMYPSHITLYKILIKESTHSPVDEKRGIDTLLDNISLSLVFPFHDLSSFLLFSPLSFPPLPFPSHLRNTLINVKKIHTKHRSEIKFSETEDSEYIIQKHKPSHSLIAQIQQRSPRIHTT